MNIYVKRTVIFGIIHLLVLAMCFLAAFTLSMERFDTGNASQSTAEYITGLVTNILMAPGKYVWTSWSSKNLHNAFEWLLVIVNSGLWGMVLAILYTKIKKST